MAYAPLPIIEVGLDELRLDLDNYRIPTRREDEAAALQYLFASEDVLGSATEIIRDGYFDNEVPIVTRGDGGYVVLEGNRRVSALKTLSDPSLAPNAEAKEGIDRLLTRYAIEAEDLPTRIRVMVAPNREAAAPYVARLHTGRTKRQWTTDQQATYYYSLLGPNYTFADLRAAYPGVDIPRNIKRAVVRRFLAGVQFSDPALHDYVAGPTLKMSSFEYAFRNATLAGLIGLEFDNEGQLVPRSKTPEALGLALTGLQLAAIEHLVAGFKDGTFNTRSQAFKKDTDEQAALLRRLAGEDKPEPEPEPQPEDPGPDLEDEDDDLDDDDRDPDGDGGGNGGTGTGEGGDAGAQGGGEERGPNHPGTKDRLDLAGIDYSTHLPVTYQHRYHELRRCRLSKTPVATTLLMRSVLEATIKFHFESTGTPATGQLQQCMQVVVNAYGGGKVKKLRSVIGSINSGDKPGSIAWFNNVTHNGDVTPTSAEIHEAFKLISPLLRFLLAPLASAPAP